MMYDLKNLLIKEAELDKEHIESLEEKERWKFKARPDHMKLLICITMYNEPFSQFLETMGGVCRAIAELEYYDPETYKNRIGVVLVADGSDKLSEDFKAKADRCGLLSLNELKNYSQDKDLKTKKKKLREYKKIKNGQTYLDHTGFSWEEFHEY